MSCSFLYLIINFYYAKSLMELLDLLEPALLNFSDKASKLGLQANWKKTVVHVPEWCSRMSFIDNSRVRNTL